MGTEIPDLEFRVSVVKQAVDNLIKVEYGLLFINSGRI